MRDVLDEIETLSKEDKEKIMAEYGKRLSESKDKAKTLESKVKSLEEELEKAPDLEKIKKEQFDLGKSEGAKEFEEYRKTQALKNALNGIKAKDTKIIQSLLDNSKIEYKDKDGEFEVLGINEQIENLKKTHEYLFEVEKPKEPEQQRITTGETHKEQPKSESLSLAGALKEKFKK